MSLRRTIEVNIGNQKIFVKSEEGEEYIKEVEAYLNRKVEEIKRRTKAVSTSDLALLTVLNVAGDYLKVNSQIRDIEERSDRLGEIIERRLL